MKKLFLLFSLLISLSFHAQNKNNNSTNENIKPAQDETAKLNITAILGLSGSVNNDSLTQVKAFLSAIGIEYKNYCPGQKCLIVSASSTTFPSKEIMVSKAIAVSRGLVLGAKDYDVTAFLLNCDLSYEETEKLKTQLSEKQ